MPNLRAIRPSRPTPVADLAYFCGQTCTANEIGTVLSDRRGTSLQIQRIYRDWAARHTVCASLIRSRAGVPRAITQSDADEAMLKNPKEWEQGRRAVFVTLALILGEEQEGWAARSIVIDLRAQWPSAQQGWPDLDILARAEPAWQSEATASAAEFLLNENQLHITRECNSLQEVVRMLSKSRKPRAVRKALGTLMLVEDGFDTTMDRHEWLTHRLQLDQLIADVPKEKIWSPAS